MKGSIYKKIQKHMLLDSTIVAVAVFVAAVLVILFMRSSIIRTNEELGESAAVDSKTALELQMQEAMLQLAQNQSTISDDALISVSRLVELVAQNVTAAVASPELHLPYPIDFPNPDNEGTAVAQLRVHDMNYYEELLPEIGLLANLSALMVSAYESLDYIASIYFATESGINISADTDSHLKVNEFESRDRPWYLSASEAGELIWTDVIVDATGRGIAIVCATPFFEPNGSLYGVVGAGMVLSVLLDVVVEARMGETGHSFIVNEHGDLIITDDVVEDESGNVVMQNIHNLLPGETVSRILGTQDGIERVLIDDDEWFVAYVSLTARPWSLVKLMSVDEVIAPALESEMNIMHMTEQAVSGINRMIVISLLVFVAAIVLALVGSSILAKRLAAGLAKPVIELSKGAEIIGAGDLEYKLDVRTGDEIESLADTFNTMISNIKAITADRERIGAELDVATNIQASMLPSIFPPFPDRHEFDIYAAMIPAKEVGGDFYDFFLVDDEKLAVVMADVSGKGVPSALFMVIAKTLIKNNAQNGLSPSIVLETVNNILCENNDAAMFVTVFLAVLDIPTGKLTYANAGHNPPLVRRAGGDYQWLPTKPGFVVAGMEGMKYKQDETKLLPGDELILYTDGVTEAANPKDELFSDAYLLEVANKHKGECSREFLDNIKMEIDIFADGAEQADDISMLVLQLKGVEGDK